MASTVPQQGQLFAMCGGRFAFSVWRPCDAFELMQLTWWVVATFRVVDWEVNVVYGKPQGGVKRQQRGLASSVENSAAQAQELTSLG